MFCINCGKEINDNQKFCRYCGTKNEIDNDLTSSNSEILNNTQSQQMNTVFNRDVLNNYLYNTRLLEISKKKLTNKRNLLIQRIDSLGHIQVEHKNLFGWIDWAGIGSIWGCCIGIVVIELIIGKLLNWIFDTEWDFIIGCIVAAIVLSIIISLGSLLSDVGEINKHNREAAMDEIRVANELEEKERLNSCLPSLKNEIHKVEALLTDAYSINIIPSKFRNIYAAYFLYDFISTSTASLNEALLHCDLDTIQQKFDEVIQQQEAMIMELAYQNALNEKIVRQNEQILGHAIQTENNAALAAQYTKIAANNTGVVAAIQISEYLRP